MQTTFVKLRRVQSADGISFYNNHGLPDFALNEINGIIINKKLF